MPKGSADYLDFSGNYNAICDRCGFKYKASKLKEEWTGFMVCKSCFEPRHPQDFLRGIPDDPSVDWTRSDTAEAGGTDINGNTIQTTPLDTNLLTDVPDGTNDGSL